MDIDILLILVLVFIGCLAILFARLFWMLFKVSKKRSEALPPDKVVSRTLTPKYQLMFGSSYLIKEDGSGEGIRQGFKIFKGNLHKGANGLCITRTYPTKIQIRYKLDKVPMLWLSRSEGERAKKAQSTGSDIKVIEPTKLGMLLEEVKDFIQTKDDSIVIFEGLEYLIVHNEFSRVLKFIHGLEDEIALHRSRLILAVNPKVLEDKNWALFEKEFKTLNFHDKSA